jgi:hypothetical protein
MLSAALDAHPDSKLEMALLKSKVTVELEAVLMAIFIESTQVSFTG